MTFLSFLPEGVGSVCPSAGAEEDLRSSERCLADPLLLLAQQQVGDRKLWLLPQSQWQEGETLRQTAERALASLSGNAHSLLWTSHAVTVARETQGRLFGWRASVPLSGGPGSLWFPLTWGR